MMVEKQRWVLSFDYDERVKSSRRSRSGVKCRCASAGAFFQLWAGNPRDLAMRVACEYFFHCASYLWRMCVRMLICVQDTQSVGIKSGVCG